MGEQAGETFLIAVKSKNIPVELYVSKVMITELLWSTLSLIISHEDGQVFYVTPSMKF